MTQHVKKEIPPLGLGTYGLDDQAGLGALNVAISMGYRHLDTAQTYGSEANVGAAMAASGLPREAFFVTTKVTASNFDRFEESVDESLAEMGISAADLVLIYWPEPNDARPVKDYIGGLARVQDAGKARLIGVSNFTRAHTDAAISEIGEGRIANNQFERHVFLQNHVLADHCAARDIAVTAYAPMAGGRLDETPTLSAIAAKHGATEAQIALAYLMALGSIVIPKSATPVRLESNLAARHVTLDADDMERLAALDCGRRFINPDWGPAWD